MDQVDTKTVDTGGQASTGGLITQQQIMAGAVKPRHLVPSPQNLGDLYYSSGSDFVNLGIGTDNQILTSVSGVPVWQTASTTIIATDLQSATTIVNVSAATAPSSGQVLTATNSTHATWQTLSTTIIAAKIVDVNSKDSLIITATASAVNSLTLINAATGNAPTLSASGTDNNIELKLASKGTKEINLSTGYYQPLQSYSPAGGGTATLDLSLGNDHRIQLPAGNITIALSNPQTGQKFLVSITQDSGGSRTVTWFTTIRWVGGTVPTLTTTASKRDTFGFVVTGGGTYDGFIVGQNI